MSVNPIYFGAPPIFVQSPHCVLSGLETSLGSFACVAYLHKRARAHTRTHVCVCECLNVLHAREYIISVNCDHKQARATRPMHETRQPARLHSMRSCTLKHTHAHALTHTRTHSRTHTFCFIAFRLRHNHLRC